VSSLLRRPRVGLALGGGAARGLAHLGVLRVLERERFPIDIIVGTSIGALVGGAYCTLGGSDETERRFLQFSSSSEFRRSAFDFIREARREKRGVLARASAIIKRGIFYSQTLYKVSFMSAEALAHNINSLLPDVDVSEAQHSFAAVAADLVTGHEVVFRAGSLRKVVSASCAIPGVLPPVPMGGRTFIDGGWVDRVPGLPARRLGADIVIGVDISPEVGAVIPTRGADVMVAATSLQAAALKRLQGRYLDHVIRPAVSGIHWADFSAIGMAVERGVEAAEEALPQLRRLLSPRRHLVQRLSSPLRRHFTLAAADLEVIDAPIAPAKIQNSA
jgi:NTE family protein